MKVRYLGINCLVTTPFPKTKIGEVRNKILDGSKLVKKTDHEAKISEIEGKYLTTFGCNKFMTHILDAKIKRKKLVS